MRIVLDANVVLSASLWRGTPWRFLEAVRKRDEAALFTSTALLEEFAGVLLRPMATTRLARIGRTAREVLADYVDVVALVTPLAVPAVIAADPDDDQVIAAAVAGRADLIISGDRHLLTLGTHRGIRIVTPAMAFGVVVP